MTRQRVTLRRAAAGDIRTVVGFRRRMFEELDDFDAARLDAAIEAFASYAHEALPSGEYVGWIAEIGGKAVGTSGLIFQTLPPHPLGVERGVGYVMNVFVLPEHRRQGIATALVAASVEHARERGCAAIALHASDEGRAVYERLGFERTNEMRLWL